MVMSSKGMNSITRLTLVIVLAAQSAEAAPRPADDPTAVAPPASRGELMLHLEDALQLAMKENRNLLLSRSEVAISEAQLRGARERPNPVVSASTSRIHVDRFGDATSLGNDFWSRSYDTIIQGGQLVEVGGKRSARRRSAAASVDAARARYADIRRTLEADLVRAYVGVALAEAEVRIARQSAGYLGDEARIASLRLKAGDISRSDLDQIEIAAARLEIEAEGAEAEAGARRTALEVLLGVQRPGGDVVVLDSLDTLADRSNVAPEGPTGGDRADLLASRAELRKAENELSLQRALRIPDPTILFQLEHNPPDRSNTVGAGVSFLLPLWNRNGGAIRAAEAARDEAEWALHRAEAQVVADVTVARTSYAEASARWRRYRDELRPRSAEVREAVSLAYEKGGASLLDLLEAQRNDNDVRLATMQAASAAAVAAADLKTASETAAMENTHP